MQTLKDEFGNISRKYGQNPAPLLHLEGFSAEQIFHQIEPVCIQVLQRCEAVIEELNGKNNASTYRNPANRSKNIPDISEEKDNDPESEHSSSTCTNVPDDIDIDEAEIATMSAKELLGLLEREVESESDLYDSDEEDSEEQCSSEEGNESTE